MKKVLAIDMGATSIRGILGYIKENRLVLEEIMRFEHKMEEENERLRWDMKGILEHVKDAILSQKEEVTSVGIDTWGVDFGLIGKDGLLLDRPICYRDALHQKGLNEAIEKLGAQNIFAQTGTQIMSINTLFQLLAYRQTNPDTFAKIDKILMMPDLIQYFLTGKMVGEETIWSTSQILNLDTGEYSDTIREAFDLKPTMFPDLVRAGHVTGSLKDSSIAELNGLDIDVISVCGHDTASAVLLTDAILDEDTMFLSCGTWSLFGVRVSRVNLGDEAFHHNMTNELGYDSAPLFFKNMTGLFLLEKYKQQLEQRTGKKLAFDAITAYVTESVKKDANLQSLIDMDDARFADEKMQAKSAIDSFLREKGLPIPKTDMDYFRVIYESMTQKYLEIKQSLEEITGHRYSKIHMIGGGAKSSLLCQLIANRLKVAVKAGPFEASALGNLLIQLHHAGEIGSMKEGIELAFASEESYRYQPEV